MGLSSLIRRFAISRDGAILPLFALMLLTLLISIGLAIDMARGTRLSVDAGGALDAAALAAAKSLRLEAPDDAELLNLAKEFFDANFGEVTLTAREITAKVDRINHGVTLVADLAIPTSIGGIVGIDTIQVRKSAQAVYDVRDAGRYPVGCQCQG